MKISNIKLFQFRNYSNFNTELSPNLNWIYGSNGQGKTNIAESIHYLCNLESFRTNKTSNIIGKNTSDAVKSGFFWGYSGLIDNIIKLIKKNTQKQFRVILTGGLSHLFKNSLKDKPLINKDLTINGLKKVILKLKI